MRRWLDIAVGDHPILFVMTLAGLAAGAVVVWVVVSTDRLPASVQVQVTEIEQGTEVSSVTVTIDRVAYHDRFQLRKIGGGNAGRVDASTSGPDSKPATVYLDGAISNESPEDVLFIGRDDSGVTVFSYRAQIRGDEVQELITRVAVGGPTCSPGDRTVLVEAGQTTRIHMEIGVEGDDAWLFDDVKDGVIGTISIGQFLSGSCGPSGGLSTSGDPWDVKIDSIPLGDFQVQAYFPTGRPTSGPLAPDGVPYFSPSLLPDAQEPDFDEGSP